MRRDLIIGVIVSIALHVSAVYLGDWMNRGPVKVNSSADDNLVPVFIPPPLPPEEPEVVETPDAPVKPIEFTPPMQQDLPQIATPEQFVQPVQIVPMDKVKPGAITIPKGNFLAGGGKIFDVSELDQIPVPTFQSLPNYPVAMRKQGVRGEVTVRFIVDPTGKVTEAHAIKSTQREFEQPAVDAVLKWKFRPGMKGGKKVTTTMDVPVVFKIN